MSERPHERPDPRLEDVLRRALEEEAAMVPTSDDGLDRIRERTDGQRRPWGPVLLAAAAVVVAAGVGVALLLGGDDTVTTTPQPVASPVATPTPSPTEEPTEEPSPTDEPTLSPPAGGESVTVPVYFALESGSGLRIAREFRAAPGGDGSTGAVVSAAVRTMLEGPADPDYISLWNPLTQVLSVDADADPIVVDLSADAEDADLGAEAAETAVQQLVYTVTAAAQRDVGVRILLGGAAVDELFGHVAVGDPVGRADPLTVRLLVQLNDPAEGAEVGPTVRVTGEAAAFEANVPWQLFQDGALVQEGFATAAECCRFAPFAFELSLAPGTYELIVTEDDPSGGEGRPPMSDSRTFSVVD